MIIENDEESEMFEITESDVQKVNRIEDIPSYRQQRSFHVKMPNEFLQKHQISLIDTPNLNGKDAFLPFLHSCRWSLICIQCSNTFYKNRAGRTTANEARVAWATYSFSY